jgi:hypothetical protein
MVENWSIELGVLTAEITLTDVKERFQIELCQPELIFMEGQIKRRGASVDVFTGPAIDITSDRDTYYVALSHPCNPLFAVARKKLLDDVESVLLDKECERVEFRYTPGEHIGSA